MRIERWIKSSTLKNIIERFHQQHKIERMNCWKFQINFNHLHHQFRSHLLIRQSRCLVIQTLNTNPQNTHSRSMHMKITLRWISKLDKFVNQMIQIKNFNIKHSSHTSHHQKSLMKKSYQRWISFTKRRRNSKTQKITSILNWQFISINADMLIYQSMRMKKKYQLCWLTRHWLVIMSIEQISSSLMIFALVCEHISRVLSDKIIISINNTVLSLTTSLRSIRTSHWLNVFVKCVHRWTLFSEIWILHITIRFDYEKTSFESVKIIQLWFSS